MKKILIASLIASGFVASTAQAAAANLTINASVTGKCTITTAPPTATLTIDPSGAGPYTTSSAFAYKCTKNFTPTTFTVGSGLNAVASVNQLKDASNNLIPYTAVMGVAAAAGNGFGSAAAVNGSVSISVSEADGQAAAASATYTDTVVVTVAP